MSKDLIDLVKQDHREIARLFDQLDRYRHRRPMLRPVLSTLLVAHHRAEEDVIYPRARDAGGAEGVGCRQREHLRTEDLLVRLGQVDPDDAVFDSILTDIADGTDHHFRREETEILPALRDRLAEDQLVELAGPFIRSRERHFGERPGERRLTDLHRQAANIGLADFADLANNDLADLLRKLADE
ncbi:hemerythrin domain-containing protein [Kribbella soli]|uniref:Hemerythrin domain-containing protein n=1 Tax=Kribbella soli TaxID=1124743 RepID=A0A4R0HFI9_9ACTN|nr:hemerythrin domain-containing protein [Kribbella soli]TCC08424.1 hemerythrin domain-containing protein [Kribbella soli]